jgi:hypothetical protein
MITVKGKWHYMVMSWEFLGVRPKFKGIITLSKILNQRDFPFG